MSLLLLYVVFLTSSQQQRSLKLETLLRIFECRKRKYFLMALIVATSCSAHSPLAVDHLVCGILPVLSMKRLAKVSNLN
ncbi:hypothetical protein DPMN_084615 [Dreissena polymorpha]|uniref:Secreted protein n=1 Tax=Dreissena polymorpha TaxID=45954 RepID=A0A9D3YB40_DREPO|nr:hypothetical protein DPMN_084615 [Dreissena polymorpha]